jgi:hypothetical protein
MLNLKQRFCKHRYCLIGKHKIVTENLYLCLKCDVYLIHHVGVNLSYKTNEIDRRDWMWMK